MKVFHPLLCYYPSQAGGPANTLYWLNSALNRSEFSSIVLSTDFGLQQQVSLADLSEKTSRPNSDVLFLNNKGKRYLEIGMASLKNSDVVQFSSLFFPPTLPLLICAIIHKKKIVISPRGELYPAALKINSFQKKGWLLIIRLFQSKIFFHATNDIERSLICQFFPRAKGVVTIPNFVKMAPKQLAEVNRFQFLFIGRINPIKNIDVLLRAIRSARSRSIKDFKLVIAGTARLPYEFAYERQLIELVSSLGLQDSVSFVGHVEGESKDNLIASSSALVLPSKSENFGNVVLEALAQGTPVIASRNTPWETLEYSNAGYWVEGSEEAISDSIIRLSSLSEIEYFQMRNNAYSLCASKFDIESNVLVWENLYNKIANV